MTEQEASVITSSHIHTQSATTFKTNPLWKQPEDWHNRSSTTNDKKKSTSTRVQGAELRLGSKPFPAQAHKEEGVRHRGWGNRSPAPNNPGPDTCTAEMSSHNVWLCKISGARGRPLGEPEGYKKPSISSWGLACFVSWVCDPAQKQQLEKHLDYTWRFTD